MNLTLLHPRALLGLLPPRWRYTFHNVVGHPLSEIAYQLGCDRLSALLHDQTLPLGAETDEGARG